MRAAYKGMETPWGQADSVDRVAEGIWVVGTPGHGGLFLALERQRELVGYFSGFIPFTCSYAWLEEDCDALVAALRWPAEFPAFYVREAITNFLSGNMGERYEPIFKWLTSAPLGLALRQQYTSASATVVVVE